MEIIIFTVVGIALYLLSDRLLSLLERIHGEPIPARNIVFFVIFLALTLPTFGLMNTLLGEGPQDNDQEQQAADGGDEPTQTH